MPRSLESLIVCSTFMKTSALRKKHAHPCGEVPTPEFEDSVSHIQEMSKDPGKKWTQIQVNYRHCLYALITTLDNLPLYSLIFQ